MKGPLVVATALLLVACDSGPKISGKPPSYWIAQLDDVDPATRERAMNKLEMLDAAHLEPARRRLHEIAQSGGAQSPLAVRILTEKLGEEPNRSTAEKARSEAWEADLKRSHP